MIENYQSGDDIEKRKDQVYELAFKLSIQPNDQRFIWVLFKLWEDQEFTQKVQLIRQKLHSVLEESKTLKDEFIPKFEKLYLEYDGKQDNDELWVKTRFIAGLARNQMPTLIKYSDDLEDALKLRYQGEKTIESVGKLLKYKDIQAYKDLKEYFTKYLDIDKQYYNHFREEEKLIPENYLELLHDDKKRQLNIN